MAFTAKYGGVCTECDNEFSAGDLISSTGVGYEHAGPCPTTRPAGKVCPSCFIELSVTGVCDSCGA